MIDLSFRNTAKLEAGLWGVYLEISAAGWKQRWFQSALGKILRKEEKKNEWWYQTVVRLNFVLRIVGS